MRVITVTGKEFDIIFWRALASQSVKNESELEVALRVLKKVKDVSLENPLNADEKAQGMVPGRKLIDEESEFIFKEDEYRLAKEKLMTFLPSVALAVADVFRELLTKFEEAEKQPAAVIDEGLKVESSDG